MVDLVCVKTNLLDKNQQEFVALYFRNRILGYIRFVAGYGIHLLQPLV